MSCSIGAYSPPLVCIWILIYAAIVCFALSNISAVLQAVTLLYLDVPLFACNRVVAAAEVVVAAPATKARDRSWHATLPHTHEAYRLIVHETHVLGRLI